MDKPQIDTLTHQLPEADEDALALAEALRWQAEHAHEALWTEAERREMEAA